MNCKKLLSINLKWANSVFHNISNELHQTESNSFEDFAVFLSEPDLTVPIRCSRRRKLRRYLLDACSPFPGFCLQVCISAIRRPLNIPYRRFSRFCHLGSFLCISALPTQISSYPLKYHSCCSRHPTRHVHFANFAHKRMCWSHPVCHLG